MNLYNLFEGQQANEDFNGLMMGVQENNPIAGALADGNGISATLGTDNDISPLTQTEGVTEDSPEVIDEVAMNPKAFAQAVKQGQGQGVLVGFEFETCIPKRSVERWKNGPQDGDGTTPVYTPDSIDWINGKTVADLVDGIKARGDNSFVNTMDDLFKYKTSVATQIGLKDPMRHYQYWVNQKMEAWKGTQDPDKIIFSELSKFLKDPETKAIEVRYMSGDDLEPEFGAAQQYNGKTFTIALLKKKTGVDFGKRVPKAALTHELAVKVQNAMRYAYRYTSSPYDSHASRIAGGAERAVEAMRNSFYPPNRHTDEETQVRVQEHFKQQFSQFCQETMGTDVLKDLLQTKWAFRGRTNNATPVLKEKLWYYLTPNAQQPQSLAPRNYGYSNYSDGAEFLKANLQDVYGSNMVIFTGYHQDTKKLDRWYIEPDGSLRPNRDDYSAEVVSPPLPAADAMTALRTWYQKAEQLNLYTNNSTGLHINVSIPGNLDVLKLAVFAGDQHVLKQFGRENNNYARSVIKSLKNGGEIPTVGSGTFKDAERQMKELVKRISGDHFATVNFNGKYVSFRHAGGDYLNKGTDIANTVGRFVRAMIIAADPQAYRQEYVGKLVKMMKQPELATGDKMPLSTIRQLAQKGIPTIKLDIVMRPADPANPTQEDITAAMTAIKRWANDNYRLEISFERDDGVRERLLNSRGFADDTKELITNLPDDMFYQAAVVPTNRRQLETFAEEYAESGANRSGAFSMYSGAGRNGKIASAVRYHALVKQDDPAFIPTIQALRGGSVKPLPLPGAVGTPSTAAATFASQRPAQAPGTGVHSIGNPNASNRFELYRLNDNEAVTMPDSRALVIHADNQTEARSIAGDWLRTNVPNASPYVYDVRPYTEPEQQSTDEGQWGIWLNELGRFARGNGTDPKTFSTEQEAQAYLDGPNGARLRALSGAGEQGVSVRQIPAHSIPATTHATDDVRRHGQRRDWIIYNPENNPDGVDDNRTVRADNMNSTEVVQRVHELEDENRLARGTLRVRYADEPVQGGEQGRFGVRDGENQLILANDGSGQPRRFSSMDAARDWIRQSNIRGVPVELDGEEDTGPIYRIINANGRLAAGDRYGSDEAALARAQVYAQRDQIDMRVVNDETGETVGNVQYDPNPPTSQRNIYTFIDSNTGGIQHRGTFNNDMSAEEYGQEMASERGMPISVMGHNNEVVARFTAAGDDADEEQESEDTPRFYQFVNPENRNVIAGYRLPNDDAALHYAQRLANQVNGALLVISDGDVVDTVEPEGQDTNEERTYTIVDEEAGEVLQHYHGTAEDAYRVARSRAEQMGTTVVVYNPDGGITGRFQGSSLHEGITSPGGSTTNDSTSPIHGYGESQDDEKIAGRYDPEDFDAMVARVGQKAREQEKRNPVDLAKLAQRLRQGDQEVDEHIGKVKDGYRLYSHTGKNLGTYPSKGGAEKREKQVNYFKHATEDEVMESHLAALKRAGYDIL